MNTILTDSNFIYYHKRLLNQEPLAKDAFIFLLAHNSPEMRSYLAKSADIVRRKYYRNSIYIRGLIEFSNYCKNDCYYCGIRKSNLQAKRYRLSKQDILRCCKTGYALGFRTFVLQSGEDPYYDDERMCDIIFNIHKQHPDCAITLSLGERPYESYKKLFVAGATRYLLRHETANITHYQTLHPDTMSFSNRMKCLAQLKEIGYQVGCGFMVGSPNQTLETLAEDLLFIQEFQPHMVGIGPFISHQNTPFANKKNGTLEDTLLLLSILRLMQPTLLLPATTALGTIAPNGRKQGILAGANVIMPNLSPTEACKNYTLYDNKLYSGDESATEISKLQQHMQDIGYQIVVDRGDSPNV
ncbi:MAG: [FeFe] hydrogenase H-cluster radical SAM maturase HydE [Eubacteriales bacterium]|nr:[FeFe] hydrogenase H-cluster radical SAM maturase HydE [Eubacteriales bacterium]